MAGLRTLSQTQRILIGAGGATVAVGTIALWAWPKVIALPAAVRAYIHMQYSEGAKVLSRTRTADIAAVKRCEDGFARLQAAGDKCTSLLKKHLSQSVFENLKTQKTLLGATLWDVISSGVSNLDAGVGVYAPDAESYKTFALLFDAVIEDYHGFKPSQHQPASNLGSNAEIDALKPLDPNGKYVLSTRVRCGRTLKGYPFNPMLTEDDYRLMEKKISGALQTMPDDELKGVYYPLQGMSKDTQKQLIDDHFLFKEGDRHLQAANACRYWPIGRGIFHNRNKTFLVWVNEEDHMRIISMQQGGNVAEVVHRLNRAVRAIESKVPFARDDRLGWLTFCPTNLGSTVRASVHIKLPKISKRKDFKVGAFASAFSNVQEMCDKMNLQIRGLHGEHSESAGGVYDISNKARLGVTEFEAVKQMYDGVAKLIEMEEKA